MASEIYNDGTYAANNESWHEEDGPFKARYIHDILTRNGVKFQSIAEIGCGSGAVLKNLKRLTPENPVVWKGYDISSRAIQIAKAGEQTGIEFFQQDLLETDAFFDVLLIIDVFEHVPDYLGFIDRCKTKAKYKIYHIPLDIHVSSTLRESLLHGREVLGHLHYFTKGTALATLRDSGHKIIDQQLTPGAIELFRLHPSFKRAIANVPRFLLSKLSPTLSARLFGGYSLLVLTE